MRTDKQNNTGRYGLWRLARYARYAVPSLSIGFILTILTVVFDLLGPYIVSLLLDGEIIAGIGVRDVETFTTMILFYAATVLLSLVTRYGGSIANQFAANHVAMVMQGEIFAHVQRLPVAYFDTLAAGQVVSRVTNDTKAVRVFFTTVLSQLLMAFVFAIGILFGLFSIDWRLFAIASLSFPILFFLFRDFQKKSLSFSREYRKGISMLNASMNENIHGIEVIQSFNRERDIYDNYSRINDTVFRNGLGMTRLHAYSGWNVTEAMNYLMLALALLYFGIGNIRGTNLVPVGHLYLFIDYMIRFFAQMNRAMQHIGNLERARGAADHIFELLDRQALPDDGEKVESILGDVAFEQVTFAYKEDEHVLRDVSFEVPRGTTAAFVGETGAGKSTIMNLLFSFYEPESGRVLIDGHDLTTLNKRSARSHMAIVTQDPFLFTGTIESNITLNRPGLTATHAANALIEVGGDSFLARLSEGVKTEVKERGNEFSAGERQLISFARALAQNPTVLILDEATSHIDTETEGIIQKGIERLSRGRTTLIIAHRLSTIRHASRIYVLDHGKIVEEGSHEELMNKGGIFANMVEMQTRQSRR
ncbi:MAG: ABC transporter ATP-binding protein/permease [Clostridiales bacterium]|jgi:ATP-binding cassette subfamily B protein|nr:ABC transporter ATP-binding protein/permease [Clostridiales bacterium]MDY0119715.1 ABC transporter ATP-binding protein [Clostridia bacterium]NLG29957.1 ABC transporter ATP-binding protein [Clostridiaceae bacterium]